MALLRRWVGGPSHQPQLVQDASPPKPQLLSPPDAKRYGLENSTNICYANSVLQALYFCSPFRELVCNTPDRSYLYPPPPSQSLSPPALPAPVAPTPAAKTAKDSKAGQQKRTAAATGDPKGDAQNAVDGDAKDNSTGPPIPSYSPTLFAALRSLFLHIAHHPGDKGTVAPTAFTAKLRKENDQFRNTNHQDAHEFLNYLLNKIVEELEQEDRQAAKHPSSVFTPSQPPNGDDLSKSIGSLASSAPPSTKANSTATTQPASHATLVHNLFEGTLTSETRCLTCETVSSRDESFLDLSIDIEQNASVTACLRQFSASEMLCQRNKFFCDSCCGLQEAEKRMKIKKSPNILALHLKRFKYQEDLQKYVKLSYRVAFPFELRLFNTVDDAVNPDRLYELFAIVVHIGSGPHHGHYITIIKAQGSWVVFDDDTVDTIKESEIPKYYGEGSSGAYVLFYQAVDLDRESLGLPPDLPVASEAAEIVANVTPIAESAAGTTIVIDPASPPPDGSGLLARDGSEEPVIPFVSSPRPKGPTPPLKLDLPPTLLTSSPAHSPTLAEPPHAKVATPSSLSKGGGFFHHLRHSTSSRASMAAARENKEKEQQPPPPPVPSLPSTPLLNGDAQPNGHAHPHSHPQLNGVKEKEAKEKEGGFLNNFRSIRVAKRKDTAPPSISPSGGAGASSPALPPASPRLPSSIPSSPRDARRPSTNSQALPASLYTVADGDSLLRPTATSLPPTRTSTIDDTNATASMSSSWTSASAGAAVLPAAGGVAPLSPALSPALSQQQDAAADKDLPLSPPLLPPPERVPSPATSSSKGASSAHNASYSQLALSATESPVAPFPGGSASGGAGGGGLTASPASAAAGSRTSSSATRTFKLSVNGSGKEEAKAKKAAAAKAAEEAKEREKKALEERTRIMREERDKRIRLEKELKERELKEQREREQREKEEREQRERVEKEQKEQTRLQKRASRKMSLSGMPMVGRLGVSFGWAKAEKEKEKEKEKDKERERALASASLARRRSQSHPMKDREEQQQSAPTSLTVGSAPKFNF